MAYSEQLADRTRAALVASRDLEERLMFGGLAFMVNGHMCCGILGEDLMVRVGPDLYQSSLAQPHTREMDFTGKPLKGMVYIVSEGLETERQLGQWVQRGLAYVSTFGMQPNRFHDKCEASSGKNPEDYETISEGDNVTFDELVEVMERHLNARA